MKVINILLILIIAAVLFFYTVIKINYYDINDTPLITPTNLYKLISNDTTAISKARARNPPKYGDIGDFTGYHFDIFDPLELYPVSED